MCMVKCVVVGGVMCMGGGCNVYVLCSNVYGVL